MMRSVFAGIVLSLVALTTELLEILATAQTLTPIYFIQSTDSLVDLESKVFGNEATQKSGQFINVFQFTDLLVKEQVVSTENQKPAQFTNIAQPTEEQTSNEQVIFPERVNRSPKQSSDVEQPTDSLTSIERAVHHQVNQYRATRGLPPLSLNSSISRQARIHSRNMASGVVAFSHDGFSGRVQAIARVIPYSGAAENVAKNQGYVNPATKAVEGWLNSTGHRTNISGNYDLTGIGVAKNAQGEYYFTQIFLSSP